MTNSRLTDPEVLEWRFPGAARGVRDPRGSGGAGRHRGGDGGERRVRFLEPMTAVMLANHRPRCRRSAWPAAAPGGSDANWVERCGDGQRENSARPSRSK